MTRPRRNMLLFVAVIALGLWAAPRLPRGGPDWALVGVLFLVLLASLWAGRDFFVGRRHLAVRRYDEAAAAFERFEQALAEARWRRFLAPLFCGLYTSNGAAIARNNVGVARLSQGRLDEAEAAFQRAAALDDGYAVAHVNLAIVAAMRGDAQRAEAESALAHRLGFRRRGWQAHVRGLLAKANTAAGRIAGG